MLTIAATLLIRPAGERWCWIIGEIGAFWLLRQIFRKLYKLRLVLHLKRHRDELANVVRSERPKEPPPFVGGSFKALCHLFGGLVAAGFVIYLAGRPLHHFWIFFATLVFLATGLLPAMATVAQMRAYNALLAGWAEATDIPEFQDYTQRLQQYRRVIEKSPTGGDL